MTPRRVAFVVNGTAQPKGSARAFVPLAWARAAVRQGRAPRAVVTTDNPRSKDWEARVARRAQAVVAAGGGAFVGPVALAITFALPRPASVRRRAPTTRPDVDKLARAVLDALTGVLYADDAQVVDLHTRKRYAVTRPGAWIAVEAAADAAPDQPNWIDTVA